MKELVIEADSEKLEEVIRFLDEQLQEADCEVELRKKLDIVTEEIFINIAYYAYEEPDGMVTIRIETGEELVITFIDEGIPYNPLAKEDPDITRPKKERPIGGLGIFIVKKIMDDISYCYEDEKNILTLRKRMC